MNEDLALLAELVKRRNALEEEIARLVHRPANIGNLGEFIAAQIFDLRLAGSGSNKAYDGWFTTGELAGKNVNVKWYSRYESVLDITPNTLPDYYLVLVGPRPLNADRELGTRSWSIDAVYLFDALELYAELKDRGVAIGIASSLHRGLWEAAEIYPNARNPKISLNERQKQALALYK